MTGLLDGRAAIVTGAGQGVGLGIAEAMAAAGAHVVIATRRLETGEPAAQAIRARGGSAIAVRTDVRSRPDIDAAVRTAVDRFGRLDCVVHNALGPAPIGPIGDADDDRWAMQLETAVTASFHCAQAAYPHLRATDGSLLLVSSAAGVEGSATLPVYACVKAAQRGLAKSLAREWGPEGIRVNCLGPVAMTPAMERAYTKNPGLEQRLIARTPLGRIGDPADDIGPAAVFLASDLARYVTGQTLIVDGGGFLGL